MSNCVLLYEDDPELRRLLLELLADDGYTVTVCQSVAEIPRAAAAQPGALALVDGWGSHVGALSPPAVAEIRALAEQVPMIMLTARAWARTIRATELGLLDLVQKPFDLNDFLVVLRHHIVGLSAS